MKSKTSTEMKLVSIKATVFKIVVSTFFSSTLYAQCPSIEVIAGSNASIQPITLCPTTFTPVPGTTFGPTNNQVRTPFPTNLYGHRIQYLYRNCELQAGGTTGPVTISQFGFHVTSVNSTPMTGFTIKMKNVATDVNWQPLQGATSPWLSFGGGDFVSGATVVYSQNYTVTATGWNMFTLSTPFVWDGVSSVLVEVCWENTSPGTGSSGVTYSQTQFTQSVATSSYTASSTTFTGAPGCNVPDVGNFNVVNLHPNRPIAKFLISNATVTPTFNPIAPICSGGTFTLPTTSTNGITGTWSPAVNNTATTTYTFTPAAGQCATTATLAVTVNPSTTPTFNPIAPICSGGTFTLPTTSTNGITGTWSPAINNTATTTYTFTPTAGQCATTATLTVNVDPPATPTFNPVAPICVGGTFNLPTTSTNGITGTWSPAVNNTATTTYTFTPSAGQCATTATLTVNVGPPATPTFNPIAPICSGGTFTLPTTSTNGITGTWSPAVNNAATTTYTFTPTAGQCATTATLNVTVNPSTTPTFNPIAPICSGGTFTLPTTSTNGITGTWSPAVNNTATTTYTFTPAAGQCATTATLAVTVNPSTTPTFNPIAPICSGGTFTLPTTSTNGITGTWSPAINNTATTTYTFTPTAGQCATTATLTVNVGPPATPTFNPVAPICVGGTFNLPTTSTNGITGTWSPAVNNTATTTYTFTPTAGQCATTATLTVNIGPPTTPTFNPIAPICSGGSFTLPTTSINGFTGTWSPAVNNTATTTYTFTPNAGQCATTATLSVTVNPSTTPTFNPVAPICSGGTFTLPTASTNGITGTWSPAINNTATTTYTFTPASGQCASTTTLTVTVNPSTTPTFNPIAPICSGGTFTLPTTSTNGITGTWSPAINNTATTTYTFTPPAGQCASTATLTVNVSPPATPTFDPIAPICIGGTFNLPTTSTNGITGTWSPTLNNTATTTYTFTPTAGQCATTATLTVNVGPPATPTFNPIAPICSGGSFTLPTTSINGFTGTWSPAVNNTATTTYTFTPNAGQCATTATLSVTVNPSTTPTFNPVAPICSGGTFALPTTSTNGITGTWSPAINNTATTTYTFTPAAGQCASSASMTVTVYSVNIFVYPNNTTIFEGESVVLTASGGITYSWSPSNGLSCDDCAVTTASPSSSTIYTVTATDASGCQGEADVLITVIPNCGEVFVPTVLSPNGAQQDDNRMACVYGNCIQTMTYSIYNRWGEKVFETQDPSNCWDGTYKGKPMNPGVFVYKLQATLLTGQDIEQSGNITLLK